MPPKPVYARKLNKSTLILTLDKEDYQSEMDSIEMFHYNKIPYFLQMDTQKENMSLKCCYDITGRHSLDQLLKYKTLNGLLLQKILTAFDQACIQAENYMLSENDILLDPEFIFAENEYNQFVYCYLPGAQKEIRRKFQDLMEYLLQKIDHKDMQAVKIAYGIHQKVAINQDSLHAVLENPDLISLDPDFLDLNPDQSESALYNSKTRQNESSHTDQSSNKDYIQNTTSAVSCRQPQYSEMLQNKHCLLYDNSQQHKKTLQHVNSKQYIDSPPFENSVQFTELSTLADSSQHVKFTQFDSSSQHQASPQPDESLRHPASPQPDELLRHPASPQPDESLRHPASIQPDESLRHPASPQPDESLRHPASTQPGEPLRHQTSTARYNDADCEYIKSRSEKKRNIKRQAAEKFKNFLHKKLYTDRSKFSDEAPVFEADEEEIPACNPTVCLMPDTDTIQNTFVYQGADRSRDFSCTRQKTILGSSRKDSTVYIPLPKISRVHAIVEIDEQGTFLEDMNSTNGTYINGNLLSYHERHLLQKGDIISLAGECYSFH